MAPREEEGTLLKRVRELLQDTSMTNLELYSATGLQPGWIDTVRRGTIKNPSVNRVQKLYEFLADQKLAV